MRREFVALGAIAALLAGCPTQELVVNQPEAPWEAKGIQTVEVPAFEAQPAAWTVPVAFATMAGLSLATARRIPVTVGLTMVRLHAPEGLDLDRGTRD